MEDGETVWSEGESLLYWLQVDHGHSQSLSFHQGLILIFVMFVIACETMGSDRKLTGFLSIPFLSIKPILFVIGRVVFS